MKKLDYSPFLPHNGSGLIFIKPNGSKVYRLHLQPKHKISAAIFDVLLASGQLRKNNIIIFNKDENSMNELCYTLAEFDVACAVLTTGPTPDQN